MMFFAFVCFLISIILLVLAIISFNQRRTIRKKISKLNNEVKNIDVYSKAFSLYDVEKKKEEIKRIEKQSKRSIYYDYLLSLPEYKSYKNKIYSLVKKGNIEQQKRYEEGQKRYLEQKEIEQKTIIPSYIAYDLETTGLNPSSHEIIEIGAIKVENGIVVAEFQELIKPNKQIAQKITGITGITNAMVKNSRSINEVLPDFFSFIEKLPMVAHNSNFDYSFLKEWSMHVREKQFRRSHYCTMKLMRRYNKETASEYNKFLSLQNEFNAEFDNKDTDEFSDEPKTEPYTAKLKDVVNVFLSKEDKNEYYNNSHRALTDARAVQKGFEELKILYYEAE